MKYLIASDIHGSAYYCQRLMEAIAAHSPDRVVLLGDLLYHGPRNDLPRDYAPKQVIEMLKSISPAPLCVRGNCEAEVDQMVLPFPVLADYAWLDVDGLRILATHGHHISPENAALLEKGDVLLYGHTHIPAWVEKDGRFFFNPGSVSIPKEGSAHSYMTLSDGVFRWYSLDDGQCYHTLERSAT